MKTRLWILALAFAAAFGWRAAQRSDSAPAAPAAARLPETRVCPMHPWVKSAGPGRCGVCGMALEAPQAPGAEVSNATATAASAAVVLPSGSVTALGIRTVEAAAGRLARTLRVAGTIGEDESRHGVISAPVEGRIDGLAMSCEGERVTQRQPIATLFSRTLLGAAQEYRAAAALGGPAAEAAKTRLLRLGLVWEQIAAIPSRQPDDTHFGLLATQSGTIVKSFVTEGQWVKEGDRLFEIADFSKMWFVFSAYEQDLPLLRVGQVVSFTTPSLPGRTLKARIAFINPTLDEASHSAQVRVVLENPSRSLWNKGFAEGVVELDAAECLAIPRGAVLWSGDGPRVVVESGPGVYEVRSVKLGRPGDDVWEVLGGLEAGERLVVEGNMLIDSQARIQQAASGAAMEIAR